MEAATAILAGASVFLFAAYMIRARALRPSEARLTKLTPQPRLSVERVGDQNVLLRRDSSGIQVIGRFLDANGYAERWATELERADLKLRPGEYFILRLLLAVATVAAFTVVGQNGLAFVVGIAAGAMMYMLPSYYVRYRTQRRIKKIESQLVETLTLIASALRAGFAFAQGVDVASKRVGAPMANELNRMLLDVNLGASMEEALSALNKRIGSDDLDMVVTAILIQRNVGGNLAEVLESVTETVRDRERIYGEIKTFTSQQRLSGNVLSVWPILIGGLFFLINPGMMSLLWETGIGLVLLTIWVILTTLGIFTIRKILNIDI
jgi:tight adherence protein B